MNAHYPRIVILTLLVLLHTSAETSVLSSRALVSADFRTGDIVEIDQELLSFIFDVRLRGVDTAELRDAA